MGFRVYLRKGSINMKNKLEYLIKNNIFIQWLYKTIGGVLFRFIGLFVHQDEHLILLTGQAGLINDSPLVIYNSIKSESKYNKYKLIWGVKDPKKFPTYDVVKMDTFKYFLTALKAKYWVASVNIERGLRFKKRNTKYLHTWHGIPIKKIGNATGKRRDFNFSNVDYFTVSSEYEVPIYINDFRVKSTSIIRTGMPRNEELYDRYDSEYLQKLKLKMNIPTNKKIILFAPTWRDSNDLGKNYDISIPVDFKEWKKKLGSQYVVLFRAHPLTTRLLNFEFDDFILNFSDYSAVNDLLLVSDLVITDYSGIMFDFLATLDNEPERRVILYPYDLDEYKRNRGIYLIYESEFEGLYTRSQDHLLKMVLLEKEYNEAKLKEIREKFLVFGGNATQQCLNYLFREITNKGELQ